MVSTSTVMEPRVKGSSAEDAGYVVDAAGVATMTVVVLMKHV